ncbi:hypothetical protein N7462_009131 [Penicillium macrosclerotiorum]|uniref:uncharacterized protein n=1 Tax=Penicillium macrosclerotiorum TaxID=303699 RepID=UPI00254822EB|nr:uncharacterized protein N7462_009131 [Penicillium macrosclerotiorum]KAJ5676234.1 hypothetical protein N7462_009131 [Penicillium macrosclerotiorum]
MASTREERLQMRQRGAGTRKIKEVDFGFSFGGPANEASDAAAFPLIPESTAPSQTHIAPTTATPAPKAPSQSHSHAQQKSGRTPTSSRNHLPERPSEYDLPSDDPPIQPSSSKRRRLNPPTRTDDTPSWAQPSKSTKDDSITTQTGEEATPTRSVSQAAVPDPTTNRIGHKNEVSSTNGLAKSTPGISEPSPNSATILARTRPAMAPLPASRLVIEPTQPARQMNQGQSPAETIEPTTEPAKENEARPRKNAPRNSTSPSVELGDNSKTQAIPRPDSSTRLSEDNQTHISDAGIKTGRRGVKPDQGADTTESPRTTKNRPPSRDGPKSRRPRARQVNSNTSPIQNTEDTVPETEPKRQDEAGSVEAQATTKAKRTRGTPPLTSKRAHATKSKVRPQQQREPIRTEPQSSNTKRRRGAPSLAQETPDTTVSQEQPTSRIEPTSSENLPPKPTQHRGRKQDKKREAQAEPGAETELEPESQPQPDTEGDLAPETESASSKSRGRRSKKSKRAADSERTPSEEQPDPEATQESNRKAREPRGETVPVTVRRLSNPAALGAPYASADGSGGDDEGSADELSLGQKTKLPNRGGVNPADVLGQICRETLEKTLATLKNGIANETNPQKRAEWTRKRRAVETFGSELDGRLLDLSEMLDSNFVLGVQLKKAKRDMMDLRSQLYKVRRERETVALQMDAVRSKHMEEEQAKMSRTTINHSLHSLELALDRSQHGAASGSDPSSADLEFLLRTVADEVSSRAPGAQGGLLHQIRAFNHQLETTARALERS